MVKLVRYFQNKDITLGVLKINADHKPIYTLERPWLSNKQDISCIPPGFYKCIQYSSNKHPNVFQIMNVPDRTAILFHTANYLSDLKGCIGVGLSVAPDLSMIGASKNAMDLMRKTIGHNNFNLEITNL